MFHAAARNFNPDMGKAARVCVAEVEHLLPAGQLTPDEASLRSVSGAKA